MAPGIIQKADVFNFKKNHCFDIEEEEHTNRQCD